MASSHFTTSLATMAAVSPPAELGGEYTVDMVRWLRGREATVARCRRQSPQLSRRRHLVEWTSEVQEKLHLHSSTLHLAVKIMDLFMDGHDIQEPQLYLVCLGALLLASKMEERDGTIPRCSQLNQFVKNYFPLADFLNLEFVMLSYFQWNLCLPTAHCTASLLLPHALLPTDLHCGGPLVHFPAAAAYLREYLAMFLRLALSEPGLIDASPSLVGTAAVFASRRAFGLTPAWPEHLRRLAGYSEGQVGPTAALLLVHHLPQLAIAAPDSGYMAVDEGYVSMSSSPVSPLSRRA